jgi:putative DNA primase/helicase
VRPESSGEYAVSEALAAELFGHLRYHDRQRKWMAYDGGIWQPITDNQAAETAVQAAEIYYTREIKAAATRDQKEQLTNLLKSIYHSNVIRNSLFFLAGKSGFQTRQQEWDAHGWLLPCENGVLDLKTMSFRPHSPDYLFTRRLNAVYDAQAKCPKWEAHISRFLPDLQVRRHVQRSLGMALVGKALDEKLEIWHGSGGNGKSTTIETLLRIFGDYATMAAPDLLIQSKHQPHPTGLADLAGRRLVFAVESDDGKHLAEGTVKFLTGDGKLKARFMRQDFFEFTQSFDIILATNHKPQIVGRDFAIWRRIRLVPWTVTIDPSECRTRDEVVDELAAESSGILNWLLKGLQDWANDNWWIAPAVKAATDAYKDGQDRICAFLEDCCELGQHYTVDKGRLYAEYCQWAQDNGEDELGKKTFGDLLRSRGIGETRAQTKNRNRLWLGVRLKP